MQWMMRAARMLAALVLVAVAMPAAAQFSDSYNFLKAVKEKDVNKARELLDKPGNTIVNTRDSDTGEAGLHIATRRSDIGWVGLLLQEGANVNLRDREGNSPLLLAAQSRWTEGVRVMILVKAQLDAQNRLGETALQKAVQNRDSATAKLLVDAGASADVTDNSGRSARLLADSDPRAAMIARMLKDVPVRKARAMQGPSL